VDAQASLLIDPINGYSEHSWHHPRLAAMSSYLGAPGSSPAGKGREDAELELGRSQLGRGLDATANPFSPNIHFFFSSLVGILLLKFEG